jgi:membrane protein YdbS with pleckstrin-like domain
VAFSRRLLNDGEHVVVSTRTHVKALLLPAVWLILLAGVAGYASSFATGNAKPLLLAVIWLIALLVVLRLVVGPFLRWLTTTYTVTDRRLMTRSGVLSRRGHDIPIARINDIAYERGIVDRILGCGTLVVSDASEHGRVRLPDVPDVERVHLRISDLLFGHTDGYRHHDAATRELRIDDGT